MARPSPTALPIAAPSLVVLAVALLAAVTIPTAVRASEPVTEHSDCHKVPAQTELDYKKMRGTWYVVQITEHLPAQSPPRATVTKQACPQVDLRPPTSVAPDMRISLQWREKGLGLLYDLRLPELTHKGYWQADRPQNGTTAAEGNYRQFEGAVLVLKATSSHAVLTFCETPRQGRKVYSVVLAREPQLPPEDLTSLEAMLNHRGLPHAGTQRTCKNYRNGGVAVGPAGAPSFAAAFTAGVALALAAARGI